MGRGCTWTVEKAYVTAMQFKSTYDWSKSSSGSYRFLLYNHQTVLSEIKKRYAKTNRYSQSQANYLFRKAIPGSRWTREEILRVAGDFDTMTKFVRRHPGGWAATKRLNLISEIRLVILLNKIEKLRSLAEELKREMTND